MIKFLKVIFYTFCFIFFLGNNLQAQQVIQNQNFTYVPTLDNRAILLKEINLKDISEAAKNYTKLKNWIKNNFTTDLINSSILYYDTSKSVLVKSKVELLLPLLNKDNMSEKSIMYYYLYVFIQNGECVMQITDIEYKIENAIPAIKNKIKAENFVTNNALKINDLHTKERIETQKGTLYFFNELANSLEKAINEKIIN